MKRWRNTNACVNRRSEPCRCLQGAVFKKAHTYYENIQCHCEEVVPEISMVFENLG